MHIPTIYPLSITASGVFIALPFIIIGIILIIRTKRRQTGSAGYSSQSGFPDAAFPSSGADSGNFDGFDGGDGGGGGASGGWSDGGGDSGGDGGGGDGGGGD